MSLVALHHRDTEGTAFSLLNLCILCISVVNIRGACALKLHAGKGLLVIHHDRFFCILAVRCHTGL